MKIREREAEFSVKFNRAKLGCDESTYHYSSLKKEKKFIKAQFGDAGTLEKYNRYRKEWHRRADEMDSGSYPLAVICELVSFCNLKCEMCYTRMPEFQKSVVGVQRIMPWDDVKHIIDECAAIGVHSMLFSWRGESSLYRSKGRDSEWHDFADVLQYARKKGVLEVTSLTNGRALPDLLIEKLVRAQPNWISFSIDGMGSDYNRIRRAISQDNGNDPFKIVINNIRKIVGARERLGFTLPQIRTNTIYPPISKNPERYRTLMEKNGVGLVTVNELLDFRGSEIPESAILNNWFCTYPFQRLIISASGVIMACPGAHNEDKELVLGRYGGVTLKEAWNSKKIKRIRMLHSANRRKEILACRYCRHGSLKHGVKWIPDDWDMKNMRWTNKVWRNG